MPSGQFGCIDPETPVFLWNGNIEKAKNIKIGDKLIGDDGTSRIVYKLTSGIDDMYEISNGHMDNYKVNSHHILTVCFTSHKKIIYKKHSSRWVMEFFDDDLKIIKSKSDVNYEKLIEFSKCIRDNNIFDINVQQYLKLSNHAKHHIKGVLNTSITQWDEQFLEIDPYIFGMWLGDGMSDGHAFASIDSELVKAWVLWLDKIGCEACHVKNIPPHETHSFYIRRTGSSRGSTAIGDLLHSSKICKGCNTSSYIMEACDWNFEKNNCSIICTGKNILNQNVRNLNPFKELLKKMKVFKNKHVPHKYIFNSEQNRLKILAGMIDTDGCLKKQNEVYHYEISQCKERFNLLESFRIIAGSLGFRARIHKTTESLYTLSIRGFNLENIPVKLKRKQITTQNRIYNCMHHSIDVKYIGKGEYCGWNIDNNERFLLGDFTITHNTRILGGKDSASPRYIFTRLTPITKILFNEHDSELLDYLDDDGQSIEPKYYIPIIPMLLVNGSEGIGTGYSTNIPCYNPDDIIANLKILIDTDGKGEQHEMTPWYRGFKGTIEKESEFKYITTGVYSIINPTTIEITELPIGKWTQTYKEFLESLIEANDIIDYKNNSDDTKVSFKIIMQKIVIDSLSREDIIKKLKLTSSINISNMHVFDNHCKIRKVNSPEEIIYRFYQVRKDLFVKRKKYLIDNLNSNLSLLESKIKFIKLVIDSKIIVFNKKKDFIIEQINNFNLLKVGGNYDYLLDLKLWTLTAEKINLLENQCSDMQSELNILKNNTIQQMWKSELMKLHF